MGEGLVEIWVKVKELNVLFLVLVNEIFIVDFFKEFLVKV